MPLNGLTRLRFALARYGYLPVIALFLTGTLIAGVGALQYVSPETTTITTQADQQTVLLAVNTSAVVTKSTPLYASGERVTDASVYFTGATPNVSVAVRTHSLETDAVAATHTIAVEYRATRNDRVFWTESVPLPMTRVGDADVARLDLREMRAHQQAARDAIGDAGSLQTRLVITGGYETDRYEGTYTEHIDIVNGERWYVLPSVPIEVGSHATPMQQTLPAARYLPLPFGLQTEMGPSLLVIGVGLVGSAGALFVGRPREDQFTLETRIHHTRYEEWISNGRLPPMLGAQTVRLDSLADLVELAIDMDKRVVFDQHRRVYAVLDGETLYEFLPDYLFD